MTRIGGLSAERCPSQGEIIGAHNVMLCGVGGIVILIEGNALVSAACPAAWHTCIEWTQRLEQARVPLHAFLSLHSTHSQMPSLVPVPWFRWHGRVDSARRPCSRSVPGEFTTSCGVTTWPLARRASEIAAVRCSFQHMPCKAGQGGAPFGPKNLWMVLALDCRKCYQRSQLVRPDAIAPGIMQIGQGNHEN